MLCAGCVTSQPPPPQVIVKTKMVRDRVPPAFLKRCEGYKGPWEQTEHAYKRGDVEEACRKRLNRQIGAIAQWDAGE
jgi:hypothetical protein